MLNTQFPINIENQYSVDLINYILPSEIGNRIIGLNNDLPASNELRLQDVYTEELWLKIKELNLAKLPWKNLRVLDVAAGEGYLSFHLLKKIKPKELVLADISSDALEHAKKLIANNFPKAKVTYVSADILKSNISDKSFDVIIGNSFVHHFYDLPEAFVQFKRMLKPGGVFIALHEPLVPAVAYESGKLSYLLMKLIRGKKYIFDIRKIKGEFKLDRNIGGDVWLFETHELDRILRNSGFISVRMIPWHFFRALFTAWFHIYPTKKRPNLCWFKQMLLRLGIRLDNMIAKSLPVDSFGSISLAAFVENKYVISNSHKITSI